MNRTPAQSFMLLMEDYKDSYTRALNERPQLRRRPYAEQAAELFGLSIFYGDSYLSAFAAAGLTASQVVPMCRPLQYRWAAEHQLWTPPAIMMRNPLRGIWKRRYGETPVRTALRRIVDAQIREARPDVLWVFSGVPVRQADLDRWRQYAGQIILWWSCPLDEQIPYAGFDLILSCIAPLVGEFRRRGCRAEYLPHAFDARACAGVPALEAGRIPRVAFVGNLSPDHRGRTQFLDALARQVELDFYGMGVEQLPADSPLRARYRGPVWGKDLYRVYGSYELVVHKNVDVAGSSASAKRLFESTGMGACLVTEASDELDRLFDRGTEVVVYRDLHDCIATIARLLADPARARAIGERGRRRTLTDHSYAARVAQIQAYLAGRA